MAKKHIIFMIFKDIYQHHYIVNFNIVYLYMFKWPFSSDQVQGEIDVS